MAKQKWTLLYRVEKMQKVWMYEPLQKHELNARIRQGWTVMKGR